MIRTFIDAGVLIAAACGVRDIADVALRLLDEPARQFVTSDLVRLEVLPKPAYHRFKDQVVFYEQFFANVRRVAVSKPLLAEALREACECGLSALAMRFTSRLRSARNASNSSPPKSPRSRCFESQASRSSLSNSRSKGYEVHTGIGGGSANDRFWPDGHRAAGARPHGRYHSARAASAERHSAQSKRSSSESALSRTNSVVT